MKNLPNKTSINDMQTHIDKAFEIIKEHLPTSYVKSVLDKLPEDSGVNPEMIRNVRLKKQGVLKSMEIFNALVEVALDNKAQKERLIQQTT